MSEILKKNYENQAKTVIKALEKRNMKGYYCPDCASAVKLADELVPTNTTVAFGGSMTLSESGVMDMLKSREDIRLIDRSKAKTPEETKQMYRDAFSSDVYFMSTNAITLDGELINIDGNGNRVAALIYGPDKIVMVVGMNKLVSTVEDAVNRVRDIAAPANGVRLNKQTPCAATGCCHDCLSPECMCSHTVITRRCYTADRIHVILVGESLGY
ncbi:MAG: lactate utilization protein [Lachnospiraceae bacterium]|nr:lactate utilization protein [Lachnospiraceae bacterium]MDD7176731.1 lactate utilization protein [bacterium]MDY5517386.1 lactate utilization protein [Lachnospiraceae bacterium]